MPSNPDSIICPIHGGRVSGFNVVRDHDHKTGQIRGYLCRQCNSRLGWMEKRLDAILGYLKRDSLIPDDRKAICYFCRRVRYHEEYCPIFGLKHSWYDSSGDLRPYKKRGAILKYLRIAKLNQRDKGSEE